MIRRSLGGDWIVDQKYILLHVLSKTVDPIYQVRLRIERGPLNNVQEYYERLLKTMKQIPPLRESNSTSLQSINGKATSSQIVTNSNNKRPFCGRELHRGDLTYCPHCGTKLVAIAHPATIKSETENLLQKQFEEIQLLRDENEQRRQEEDFRHKQHAKSNLWGCLTLSIILICVLLYFLNGMGR